MNLNEKEFKYKILFKKFSIGYNLNPLRLRIFCLIHYILLLFDLIINCVKSYMKEQSIAYASLLLRVTSCFSVIEAIALTLSLTLSFSFSLSLSFAAELILFFFCEIAHAVSSQREHITQRERITNAGNLCQIPFGREIKPDALQNILKRKDICIFVNYEKLVATSYCILILTELLYIQINFY